MAFRLDFAAAGIAVGMAFALYTIKHDTRLLEQRIQIKERALDKAEGDIAVLAAERAWLARPERVEALARSIGLAPVTEAQYEGIERAQDDGISQLLRGSDAVQP